MLWSGSQRRRRTISTTVLIAIVLAIYWVFLRPSQGPSWPYSVAHTALSLSNAGPVKPLPTTEPGMSTSSPHNAPDSDNPETLPYYYSDPNIHKLVIPPRAERYYEIASLSGENGKFFPIDFHGRRGVNPNIIPHEMLEGQEKYIIVAQQDQLWEGTRSGFITEMVCLASFVDGRMRCDHESTTLPISMTMSENCGVLDDPVLGIVAMGIGPHDARVFHGPDKPYIIFGSQSNHHSVCLGQWLQDFRVLVEWGPFVNMRDTFAVAKDIQRPPPMRHLEKNYFVFWDANDTMYAHYDFEPQRAFAAIDTQGAVVGGDKHGGDLARAARQHDSACWKRFMEQSPFANGTHQGTNSLSVTMCRRRDSGCTENDENTVIMHIFQKKVSFGFGHAFYLPYVVLFRRTPPFELYGITERPFWVKGQRDVGEEVPRNEMDNWIKHHVPDSEPEMLYMTSINWKDKGNRYHGFIDDVLFLSFGREDAMLSALDIRPEKLIGDLMMCDD